MLKLLLIGLVGVDDYEVDSQIPEKGLIFAYTAIMGGLRSFD